MRWRCVCLCLLLLQGLCGYQDPFSSDLNSLRELPLEKLLLVKNSLELDDDDLISALKPKAQALRGKLTRKQIDRTGYDFGWMKKTGKKHLSTLFQISVTALAFLAFGAYLICLLVQALKYKYQNYYTTTTTGNAVVITPFLRPGRKKRQTWPEADSESLYRALKMLSEGYATYYQADYKYMNFTSNY